MPEAKLPGQSASRTGVLPALRQPDQQLPGLREQAARMAQKIQEPTQEERQLQKTEFRLMNCCCMTDCSDTVYLKVNKEEKRTAQ